MKLKLLRNYVMKLFGGEGLQRWIAGMVAKYE